MAYIRHPTHAQRHGAWTCVGPQAHERKDGSMTTLYVGERPCRTCGAAFQAATTGNFAAFSTFELVNCKLHRRRRRS